MQPFLVIVAAVGALLVVACVIALIQRRLHPRGYECSPQQVRAELQKIADGRDVYALDEFISVPLKDRRLETIRQRVIGLAEEFPPESKGAYCGPAGIEIIRGFIRELERDADEQIR